MDDDRFERHLVEYYPAGPLREPRFWRDPRYNNPMQPVIGISCFEARAYAAWLAAESGRPFRLPTEAQWEAAARGRQRRAFAYGDDFDALRGNTVETHVRAPTPVGVFPEGDTPEGIADLTGNTYDLTSSLWGDDPLHTSWPYPYRADDGREAVDIPVTVSRVGRGGAWYLGERPCPSRLSGPRSLRPASRRMAQLPRLPGSRSTWRRSGPTALRSVGRHRRVRPVSAVTRTAADRYRTTQPTTACTNATRFWVASSSWPSPRRPAAGSRASTPRAASAATTCSASPTGTLVSSAPWTTSSGARSRSIR